MSIELTALQQQRRDTAANWTGANPTLLTGELGYETDTGKFKIGDGSTAWTSLSYLPIPDVNGLIPIDQLLLPAGTAAAPSLTFTGDVNTGIYSPGADQVAISTNGTGRLFVDADGNIGIGGTTTTGWAQKQVVLDSGSGASASYVLVNDTTGRTSLDGGLLTLSGSDLFLINRESANLIFRTANTERLRITSDGKLGLGTSSPSQKLEVGNVGGNVTTGDLLVDTTSGAAEVIVGRLSSTGGDSTSFRVRNRANGQLFFVDGDSGNVGVGTTSPGLKMHIQDGALASAPTPNGNCDVVIEGTNNTGIQFLSDTQTQLRFGDSASTAAGAIIYQHTDDNFKFNYSNSGFLTFNNGSGEVARIDSSGNVGVGTSSPSSRLHVNASDGAQLLVQNTSTSSIGGAQTPYMQIDSTGGYVGAGSVTGLLVDISADSTTNKYAAIFNGGNVGIGTISPKFSIQTQNGGFDDRGLGSGVAIRNNIYYSSGDKYLTGSGAASTQYFHPSGNIIFYNTGTASTGADNAVSLFERMRILSSGGITFNGDTATANALDDYEEGTWIPSIQGSTTAGTVTYSTNIGKYTKIGNTVFWEMYSAWSGGTGSGALYIYGLPFTVQSASPRYPAVNIGYVNNYTLSANHQLTGLHASGNSYLYFYQIPSGGGTSIALPYDAAASIILSGHYIVN